MADDTEKCPYCDAEALGNDEQPYPSLHAFTILYECGTEIIIVLGRDGFITEKRCHAVR